MDATDDTGRVLAIAGLLMQTRVENAFSIGLHQLDGPMLRVDLHASGNAVLRVPDARGLNGCSAILRGTDRVFAAILMAPDRLRDYAQRGELRLSGAPEALRTLGACLVNPVRRNALAIRGELR